MGIQVDDAHGLSTTNVPQEMAVRRLMAATQHDWEGASAQNLMNDGPQALLALFQAPLDSQVSRVQQGTSGQVHVDLGIAGRQAIEPGANGGRRGGCPGSAVIAADALILGKPDQHRAARPQGRLVPGPEFGAFPEPGIVWTPNQVIRPRNRL